MTIERFQGIVLKIGNQVFVRHYFWLNYPNDPQIMGVQLQLDSAAKPVKRARARLCECGICKRCKHREYTRKNRAPSETTRILRELTELGFSRRDDGIWVIERSIE